MFGHVALIITISDKKEAIKIINDFKFGLGDLYLGVYFKQCRKSTIFFIQSGIVTANNVKIL